MSLKSPFVAKVVTKIGGGKLKMGTAYPIREGVILTAYHVIPDIDDFQQSYLKWVRDDQVDEGENVTPHHLTEILYVSEKYDVLIAKCKTPDHSPDVTVSLDMPKSDEKWESLGYPKSGIDNEKGVRLKDPAGGEYFFQKEDHWEQHLESKADPDKTSLWQGMSGAPVFTVGTKQLTAIITKVPAEEDPQHKDRIYVTSLAYLLNKLKDNTKFQTAIYGDAHSCQEYIEAQQSLLLRKLNTLNKDSAPVYKALLNKFHPHGTPEQLHQSLLEDFHQQPADTIENLHFTCEAYLFGNEKIIEAILLCLLSQRVKNRLWDKTHLHDLHVRTHLLCELHSSSYYETTPNFRVSDSGHVIGMGAIESTKDVGFGDEENAKERAKTIAYALYKRPPFHGDLAEDRMDEYDWKAVNTALKARRKSSELIRYEIDRRRSENDALLDEDVQQKLHNILQELPIILFGEHVDGDEHDLDEQIKLFYEKLNK